MTRRQQAAAWLTGALLWGAAGRSLFACPICFQIEQGPVTDGVRAAVFVLMAVTVVVLTGFGMFVARLARADRLAESTNPRNPGTLGTPEPVES